MPTSKNKGGRLSQMSQHFEAHPLPNEPAHKGANFFYRSGVGCVHFGLMAGAVLVRAAFVLKSVESLGLARSLTLAGLW